MLGAVALAVGCAHQTPPVEEPAVANTPPPATAQPSASVAVVEPPLADTPPPADSSAIALDATAAPSAEPPPAAPPTTTSPTPGQPGRHAAAVYGPPPPRPVSAVYGPPPPQSQGRTTEEIRNVFAAAKSRFRACWDKDSKAKAPASGRLSVTIAPEGRVVKADFKGTNLDTATEQCLVSEARRLRFGPASDTVTVEFPLVFAK